MATGAMLAVAGLQRRTDDKAEGCRPSLRCLAELELALGAAGVAFATETAVENKDGDRRATAVASTTARRCRAQCGAVVFLGPCLSPSST